MTKVAQRMMNPEEDEDDKIMFLSPTLQVVYELYPGIMTGLKNLNRKVTNDHQESWQDKKSFMKSMTKIFIFSIKSSAEKMRDISWEKRSISISVGSRDQFFSFFVNSLHQVHFLIFRAGSQYQWPSQISLRQAGTKLTQTKQRREFFSNVEPAIIDASASRYMRFFSCVVEPIITNNNWCIRL